MLVDEVLAVAFVERHPERAAGVLERLDPAEAADAIAGLPPEGAAAVLSHSTTAFAAACLASLSPERAAEIVERMDLDVDARVLRTLSESDRAEMVAGLAQGTRAALERLLRFPEGTAGSVMEPRVLALPQEIAAVEALSRLERDAQALRGYVYVVDRHGALVGVVAVREVMMAAGDAALGSIMHPAEATVSPFTSIPDLIAHPGWHDFYALPVVDEKRALLGAVRYSTYRRLERETAGRHRTSELVVTGVALAELYWLLLTRALAGAGAATAGPAAPSLERGSTSTPAAPNLTDPETEGDPS